jgi:C-terminal processing protease CtpA/Prc
MNSMRSALCFVAAGLAAVTCCGQAGVQATTQESRPATQRISNAASGFVLAELRPAQVDNLAMLGKVWGFLKYHHPRITSGALNWDAELLRLLPQAVAATDRAAMQAQLVAWVDSLGEVSPCSACASAGDGDVNLRPNLAWLSDRHYLGEVLCQRLALIHARRPANQQFYVAATSAGNADFSREDPYPDLAFPDPGYQILALFRLWNAVEYWFAYRDHVQASWDRTLTEFLPRLASANSKEQYARALMAFIARLEDSHANVWNATDFRPPVGACTAPVKVRWIEGAPTIVALLGTEPNTSLRVGDVVKAIAERTIDDLVKESAPYVGASNESSRRRDIARFMFRGPCDSVAVTVERKGRKLELPVARVRLPNDAFAILGSNDRAGDTFQVLTSGVAYIKASAWKIAALDSYLQRAAATKGLIIDLRGYPAEFAVFALGSRLVDKPTPFARFTRPDFSNPGAFVWTAPVVLSPTLPTYGGRVAILVDEMTQSQAEYTAMALRSSRNAIVIGTTTAGADGNLSRVMLPGRLMAGMSGLGVFYEDGRPTQRVGIVPDVIVEPTLTKISEGRDEVLEAAVREVLEPAQRGNRVP